MAAGIRTRHARSHSSRGGRSLHSLLTVALAVAVLAGCSEGNEPAAKRRDLPTVQVTRVIDGDSVVATKLGKTRLIGIDTPEED